MEKSAEKSNLVAIIVPTLNRPDFVIRQLNYYASLNFPHPIYYSDSSNPENAKKIKDKIDKLRDKLNIIYLTSPAGDVLNSYIQLLSAVKEKYTAILGDDDYWVPDTLNQCVEFLEKNPDYESAQGKSVSFKTEGNAVFGKIKVIYDYPKHSLEDNTASERLFNYLGPKSSTIGTSVVRTDHFLKYHQIGVEIKDFTMRTELLLSCLISITGKLKIIDKLGFAHQIHDNYAQPNIGRDTFDWIIDNENWYSSYILFRNKIVAALMAKDDISQEKAEQVFKQSFWCWINQIMHGSYDWFIMRGYMKTINPPSPAKKSLRTKITTRLPLLKRIYRKLVTPIIKKGQLHYEVIRPGSKYYEDFKPIVDSLRKTDDTY